MAATILGAIHERWNDDSGLSEASLTLWNEEPLEGTDLGSYVVLEGFDAPETLMDSAAVKMIEATWDFVAYVPGTEGAEVVGALIKAAYLWPGHTLSVDGMRCLFLTRTGYAVDLDRTRSTETRRVTEIRASYLAQMQG